MESNDSHRAKKDHRNDLPTERRGESCESTSPADYKECASRPYLSYRNLQTSVGLWLPWYKSVIPCLLVVYSTTGRHGITYTCTYCTEIVERLPDCDYSKRSKESRRLSTYHVRLGCEDELKDEDEVIPRVSLVEQSIIYEQSNH